MNNTFLSVRSRIEWDLNLHTAVTSLHTVHATIPMYLFQKLVKSHVIDSTLRLSTGNLFGHLVVHPRAQLARLLHVGHLPRRGGDRLPLARGESVHIGVRHYCRCGGRRNSRAIFERRRDFDGEQGLSTKNIKFTYGFET